MPDHENDQIPTINLSDKDLQDAGVLTEDTKDTESNEVTELQPIPYEAVKVAGWSYENAIKEGYQPTMMSYDEAYAATEKMRSNLGITDDQFKVMHSEVLNESVGNAKKKYNWDAIELSKTNPLGNISTAPLTTSILNPQLLGLNYDTKQTDVRVDQLINARRDKEFDMYGSLYRTMTDDESAETSGLYKDQNGQYQDISIYQMLDENGERYRIDENGNKKILALTHNAFTGQPEYQEVDANKFHKESVIRSYLGPKTMGAKDGAFTHGLSNFYNTMWDQTLGTAATLSEHIGMAVDYLSGNKEPGWLTQKAAEMQNYTAVSKSKTSEYDDKLGIFDGWRGFSGELGNITANIAGVYAMSRITGMAGLLTGATANTVNMLAKGAGWTMGAGYAANRMNETAREMGIEGWKRSVLTALSASVVLGSEKFLDKIGLSGYLDNMIGSGNKSVKLDELTDQGIRNFLRNAKSKIDKASTPQELIQATATGIGNIHKNTYSKLGLLDVPVGKMKKMGLGFKNAASATTAFLRKNKFTRVPVNIISEGKKEGLQELTEEFGESLVKMSYDFLEDNFTDNNSTVGNGLFGAELPTFNEMKEIFAAGFVGGSFGGIGRSFDPLHKDQEISNHMISEIAAQHSSKDKADAYLRNKYLEILDNPLLTADDKLIAAMPPEERANAKSKNDLLYESLQQQLDLAWETKTTKGLNDANNIQELMGGDMALAKDVIALTLDKDYYGKVYEDYQSQIDNAKTDQERELLKEKADTFKEIIEKKDERLNYIMSGQMYSNYSTAMHANAILKTVQNNKELLAQIEDNDKMTDEQKTQMSSIIKMQIDAIENDGSDFHMNDMAAAYEMSNYLKNNSNILKEQYDEIKKRREDFESKYDPTIDDDIKELEKEFDESDLLSFDIGLIIEKGVNGFTKNQANKLNALINKQKKRTQSKLNSLQNKDLTEKEKGDKNFLETELKGLNQTRRVTNVIGLDSFKLLSDAQEILDDRNRKRFSRISKAMSSEEIEDDESMQEIGTVYVAKNLKTGQEEEIESHQYIDRNKYIKQKNDAKAEGQEDFTAEDFSFQRFDDVTEIQRVTEEKQEDSDGNVSYKEKIQKIKRQGLTITEEQKALLDQIVKDGTDSDVLNYIVQLYEDIYKGKIKPDIDLIKSLESTRQDIQRRINALTVVANINKFQKNDVNIDPKARKNLGMDFWNSLSEEDLNLASSYLYDILGQVNNLINFISRQQNVRKEIFEKYAKENRKISAEISNNFLDWTSKYIAKLKDGIAVQTKDGEAIIPVPQRVDAENDELTDAQISQMKQFWHYFFNQQDENGNYFILEDAELQSVFLKELAIPDNRKGQAEQYGRFGITISDFTLDNFKKTEEQIDKEVDDYTYRNYIRRTYLNLYFNSVVSIDPYELESNFDLIIDKVKDGQLLQLPDNLNQDISKYKSSHNPEQRNVLEQVIANIILNQRLLDDQQFNKSFTKKFTDKKRKWNNDIMDYQLVDKDFGGFDEILHNEFYKNTLSKIPVPRNIQIVEGNAGTGKSSFVVKSTLEIAKNMGQLNNKTILLVAPNPGLLESLKKTALGAGIEENKIEVILEDEFFKRLTPAEGEKGLKDNFIIFDEYSLVEGDKYDNLVNRFNDPSRYDGNNIILLGDKFQAPATLSVTSGSLRQRFKTIPNMVTVMRTGFEDVIALQDYFRSEALYDPNNLNLKLQQKRYYKKDGENYYGALVRGGREAEKRFMDFAVERVNKGAALIVFDNDERNRIIDEGRINENMHGNIFVISDKQLTPQGKNISEAHVYMPLQEISNKYKSSNDEIGLTAVAIKKYALTAVSRGEQFVHLYISDDFTSEDSEETNALESSSLSEDVIIQNKVEQYENQQEILSALVPVSKESKPTKALVPYDQGLQAPEVAEPQGEFVSEERLIEMLLNDKVKRYPDGSTERRMIDALSEEKKNELLKDYYDAIYYVTLNNLYPLETQQKFDKLLNEIDANIEIYKQANTSFTDQTIDELQALASELEQLQNQYSFVDDYLKRPERFTKEILQSEDLRLALESDNNDLALSLLAFLYNQEDSANKRAITRYVNKLNLKDKFDNLKKDAEKIANFYTNTQTLIQEINKELEKKKEESGSKDEDLDDSDNKNDKEKPKTTIENFIDRTGENHSVRDTLQFDGNSWTIETIELKEGEHVLELRKRSDNTIQTFTESELVDAIEREINRINANKNKKVDSETAQQGLLATLYNNEDTITGLGFIAIVDQSEISDDINENKETYARKIKERINNVRQALNKETYSLVTIKAQSINTIDFNGNQQIIKRALVFYDSEGNYLAAYNIDADGYNTAYKNIMTDMYNDAASQTNSEKDIIVNDLTYQNFYFQNQRPGTESELEPDMTLQDFDNRIQELQLESTLDKDENGNPKIAIQRQQATVNVAGVPEQRIVSKYVLLFKTAPGTQQTSNQISDLENGVVVEPMLLNNLNEVDINNFIKRYTTIVQDALSKSNKMSYENLQVLHDFFLTNKYAFREFLGSTDVYQLFGFDSAQSYGTFLNNNFNVESGLKYSKTSNENIVELNGNTLIFLNEFFNKFIPDANTKENNTTLSQRKFRYVVGKSGDKQNSHLVIGKDERRFFTLPRRKAVHSGGVFFNFDKDSEIEDITFSTTKADNKEKQQSKMLYETSKDEAEKVYVEMLGEGHFANYGGFTFFKKFELPSGDVVNGYINKRGKMFIAFDQNGKVSLDAVYHEIIHFIDNFLLDENQRTDIYNEIERKKGLKDKAAREYLADMGAEWMSRRKRLPGWSQKFFHFMDWLAYHLRKPLRLLGYANYISDLYYNAYYKKAYANGVDIKEANPEFEGAPSLYRNDVNISSKYGNDNNIANAEKERIISFGAEDMLTSDLSRVKDNNKIFTYDNMINNIEYENRKIILDHLIQQNTTFTKNGITKPILKYTLKDKNKPVTMDNIDTLSILLASNYDMNDNEAYVTYRTEKQSGKIAFANKKTRQQFRKDLRNILKTYEARVKDERNILGSSESKSLEFYFNLSQDKIKNITSSDYNAINLYTSYLTLDDNFLFSVIQDKFPNLDIGNPKNPTEGVFYENYDDIEDRSNNIVFDTVSKKENVQVRLTDRQSDMLKFSYSSIPFLDIAHDGNEFKIINVNESGYSKGYVSQKEMNRLLLNYINKALSEDVSSINKYDSIVNYFDKMYDQILSNIKDANEQNYTSSQFELSSDEKHFLSFYDHYFNKNKNSHRRIIQDYNSLGNEKNNRAKHILYNRRAKKEGKATLTFEQYMSALPMAYEQSTKIISAILNHYSSSHIPAITKTTFTNYKGDSFTTTTQVRDTSEFELQFKSFMKEMFLDSSNVLNKNTKNFFFKGQNTRINNGLGTDEKGGRASMFEFRSDGVYFYTGLKNNVDSVDRSNIKNSKDFVKVIAINERNQAVVDTNVLSLAGKSKVDFVVDFINEFGFKGFMGGKAYNVANALKNNDALLNRFVLNMGLSSYIYAANYYKNESNTFNVTEEGIFINDIMNNADKYTAALQNTLGTKYGQTDINSILDYNNDEFNELETGTEVITYSPLSMSSEIKQISEILAKSYGEGSALERKNIEGKTVQSAMLKNNADETYSNGNNKRLVNEFEQTFKDTSDQEKLSNTNNTHKDFDGNIATSNPVLQNANYLRASSKIDGINYNGRKGRQLDEIVTADRYANDIAQFFNHINKNIGSESVIVSVFNTGERKNQDIHEISLNFTNDQSYISNGIFRILKSAVTEDKLDINNLPDALQLDTNNIFKKVIPKVIMLNKAAQNKSLNNWVTFINNYNEKNNINKTIDLVPVLDLSKIKNTGKRYNLVADLKDAIIDNTNAVSAKIEQIKTFLKNTNLTEKDFINNPILRKSRDLIVKTDKQGNTSYDIGLDATMNRSYNNFSKQGPDGVFNFDNLYARTLEVNDSVFKEGVLKSIGKANKKAKTTKVKVGDLILLESMLDNFGESLISDSVEISLNDGKGNLVKDNVKREKVYESIINEIYSDMFNDSHKHAVKNRYRLNNVSKIGLKDSKGNIHKIWKGYLIAFNLHNTFLMHANNNTYASFVKPKVDLRNNNPLDAAITQSKRYNIPTSPGTSHVNMPGRYAIPKEIPMIVVEDVATFVESYHSVLGYNKEAVELYDGEIIENPLLKKLRYKNHGSNMGPLSFRGPRKTINNTVSHKLGVNNKFKSAQFDITQGQLNLSRFHNRLLEMFLNPNKDKTGGLYSVYLQARQDGKSFDEAIDDVMEAYVENKDQYTLVAGIAFQSAKKDQDGTHAAPLSVNRIDSKNSNKQMLTDGFNDDVGYNDLLDLYENAENPNILRFATPYDVESERVQLNANKPIDVDKETSMEQLMSIILASPHLAKQFESGVSQLSLLKQAIADQFNESAKELDSILFVEDSISEKLEKLNKKLDDLAKDEQVFSANDLDTSTKMTNFVLNKVKESIQNSGDTTLLSRLLNADIKTYDLGGVRERVIQYLSSYITKTILKPKTTALRVIQEAGEHVVLFEVFEKSKDKDGNVIRTNKLLKTLAGVKEYAQQKGLDINFDEQGSVEFIDSKTKVNARFEEFKNDDAQEILILERKLESEKTILTDIDVNSLSQSEQQEYIKLQNNIAVSEQSIADHESGKTLLTKEELSIADKLLNERKNNLYKFHKKYNALQVVPGEIVMPNTTLKKYGINENNSLHDLFRIQAINDQGLVSNIEQEFRNILGQYNYKNKEQFPMLRTQLKKLLSSVYKTFNFDVERQQDPQTGAYSFVLQTDESADISSNPIFQVFLKSLEQEENIFVQKRNKEQKKVDRDNKNKTVEKRNQLKAKVRDNILKTLSKDAMGRAVNLATDAILENWIQMMSLSVRTPSGPGSGHFCETIETLNDNGSTALYNTRKNDKDDSDQDIDQNTIYFFEATMQYLGYLPAEVPESRRKKEALGNLQNQVKEFLFDYYSDPQQDDINKIRTQLDTIKSYGTNIHKQKFNGNSHGNSYMRSAEAGSMTFNSKAVGVYAIGTKGLTSVISAINLASSKDASFLFNNTIVDEEGNVMFNAENLLSSPDFMKSVVKMLELSEAHVHGATVTAKEAVLDFINAFRENGMLLNTLVLFAEDVKRYYSKRQGVSLDDVKYEDAIYGLMTSKAMQDISSFIKDGKKILSFYSDTNVTSNAFRKYKRLNNDRKNNLNELQSINDDLDKHAENVRNLFKDLKVPKLIINNKEVDVAQALEELRTTEVKQDGIEVKTTKSSPVKKILNRLANIARTEAQKNYDVDLDDKTIFEKANVVERLDDNTVVLSDTMKQLFYNIYKMQELINKKRDVSLKLNPKYNGDIFNIAKYGIMSDAYADYISVVGLNQGVPNSAYDKYTLRDTIQKLTGYKLEDLLKLYEEYDGSNLDEYLDPSKNRLAHTLEKKREVGFEKMKNTFAKDQWMLDSIERTFKENNVEVTETLNYHDTYHQVIDAVKMFFVQPDLMERIKTLGRDIAALESTSIIYSPAFKEVRAKVLDIAGLDRFTKQQFVKLNQEMDNFLLSEFYKQDEVKTKFNFALKSMEEKMQTVNMNQQGKVQLQLGIDNMYKLNNFAQLFPKYFLEVIMPNYDFETGKTPQEIKQIRNFLDTLQLGVRNNVEYIATKLDNKTLNPAQINNYTLGFMNLPQEIKTLIEFYETAKFGLYYSQSAFSKVLDVDLQKDFSEFIKNYKSSKEFNSKEYAETLDVFIDKVTSEPNNGIIQYGKMDFKNKNPRTGQIVFNPPVSADGFVKKFIGGFYHEYNKYRRKLVGIPTVKKLKKDINNTYLALPNVSAGMNIGAAKTTGIEVVDNLNPNLIVYPDGMTMMAKFVDIAGHIRVNQYVIQADNLINQDKYAALKTFFANNNVNTARNMLKYAASDVMQEAGLLDMYSAFKKEAIDLSEVSYNKLEAKNKNNAAKKFKNKVGFLDTLLFDINPDLEQQYTLQNDDIFAAQQTEIDYDSYKQQMVVMMANVYSNYIKSTATESGNALQDILNYVNSNPQIQKIFTDKNTKSNVKPSQVLSYLMNQYAASDIGLSALSDEYSFDVAEDILDTTLKDDAYVDTRVAASSYTNNHDKRNSNVVELNFNIEKEIFDIVGGFKKIEFNETNVEQLKNIVAKYQINKDRINSESAFKSLEQELKDKNIINEDSVFTDEQKAALEELLEDANTRVVPALDTDRLFEHQEIIDNNNYDKTIYVKQISNHKYNTGDILHFRDGNIGVVVSINLQQFTDFDRMKTVKYSKEYSYKLLKNKSRNNKTTLDSRIGSKGAIKQNNSKRKLKGIAKILSRAIPNVLVKFIDNQTAVDMGKGEAYSFVGSDGVVYINEDKADKNIMLHEFAHPVLLALQNSNPLLFETIYEKLKDTPLANKVKEQYAGVSENQMKHEIIANFLQQKAETKKMPNLMRRLYQGIKDFFFNLFSPTKYSAFNKLDFNNSTIDQIADALIEDMFFGRQMTNISSQEISTMLDNNFLDSRYNMLNLQEFTTPKDLNDNELFSPAANYIRNLINKSISDKTLYVSPSGKQIDFSENAIINGEYIFRTNNVFDRSKRNSYINEVIKEDLKNQQSLEGQFVNFLNDLNKNKTLFESATDTFKKGWKGKQDKSTQENEDFISANNEKLQKMLVNLNFNPKTDKAVFLSDIGKPENLGINIDKKYFGTNPLVIIHQFSRKKIGSRIPSISIVNLTYENPNVKIKGINNKGQVITQESKIGSQFYTPMQLAKNGITLKNNQRDINFMTSTLQAMAIKQQNPNVRINMVGTLHIKGRDTYSYYPEKVKRIIPQINYLFSKEELRNDLDESLRLLINDKKVTNVQNYNLSFIEILKDYAESSIANFDSNSPHAQKAIVLFENVKKYADDIEKGTDRLSTYKLSKLLLSIIKYKRSVTPDYKDLVKDQEYRIINEAYMKLTSIKSMQEMEVQDLGLFEFWLQSADRWDDDYSNYVTDQIQVGIRKSKESFIPFMRKNKEMVNKLNNFVKTVPGFESLTFRKGSNKEFYKPLYKTIEVPVVDSDNNFTGENKTISLHEIHWDINDADTQKAIKEGKLTEEHVKYGKFIMDQFENEFINYLKYKVKNQKLKDADFRKMSTEEQDKFLTNIAEDMLKVKWKKGMLPILPKKATDALTDDGVKAAAEIFWRNATRIEGAFDDYFMDDEYDLSRRHKLSPQNLWSQFEDNQEYGSRKRLEQLGLTYINGEQLVLQSEHQHNMISYDLGDIANYTMMSSSRTRNMDDAIEAVNVANDLLHAVSASTGQNVDKTLERIKVYVNRNVYGDLPATQKVQAAGVNIAVDNLINVATKGWTSIVMGFGPTIAAKNFMSGQFSGILNGISNQIAGSHEFSAAQFTQAWGIMTGGGWKKIQAINDKLQLVAMSERELLNSVVYNKQKQNLMESDMTMFLHFAGDYVTKLACMTAQMIKDGTYDAFDSEGNYDYKKDKRFYTTSVERNGVIEDKVDFSKMSDEGKVLYEFTKDQLIKEGTFGQRENPDGALQSPYFAKQIQSIEVLNQRATHDVTNSEYKDHASAYGIARAIFPLKNYIKTKFNQWAQKPHVEKKIGQVKIFRNEEGKLEGTWEGIATEGILYTILDSAKKMKEYRLNPVKTWDNLNVEQKKNMMRGASHAAFFMGTAILISLLFDDEDDETTPLEYVTRKVVGGAAAEKIVDFNLVQIFNDAIHSPNLIISSFENLFALFLSTLQLPFMFNDEDFREKVSEYLYDATRVLPGGALMRDIANMFEDFINDYLSTK